MTSFYIDSQEIGTRAGAGKFCWTCDESLCVEGVNALHFNKVTWFPACPKCGAPAETLQPQACSFIWSIPRRNFDELVRYERIGEVSSGGPIKDQYGNFFSLIEFEKMLRTSCPLQFATINGQRERMTPPGGYVVRM